MLRIRGQKEDLVTVIVKRAKGIRACYNLTLCLDKLRSLFKKPCIVTREGLFKTLPKGHLVNMVGSKWPEPGFGVVKEKLVGLF